MSVEATKKALRQEATRLRLKRLREGKNPITGTAEKAKAKPKLKPAEKSILDKIKDFFGQSALEKAGR